MFYKYLPLMTAVSVAILGMAQIPAAVSADTVVSKTTVMTACRLFDIDSNAGLLTPEQRVQIIQNRLDRALVNAKDLRPQAVTVREVNRNPVVLLDSQLIATADGNSADRNQMTQLQLAEKWADSIRMCLADADEVNKYISMLTGKFPVKDEGGFRTRDEIAVLTPSTMIPLKLVSPISAFTASVGDKVEAVVSTNVPMGPSYTSYLPAGTVAMGEIIPAAQYTRGNYAGKESFTVQFYNLRTIDGKDIPIDGHILGALDQTRTIEIKPVTAASCLDGPPHAIHAFPETEHHLVPTKGYVVGAWKGTPIDELFVDNYPRAVFSRDLDVQLSAGEPLLLRLTSNTAIALAGQRQFVSVVTETH